MQRQNAQLSYAFVTIYTDSLELRNFWGKKLPSLERNAKFEKFLKRGNNIILYFKRYFSKTKV